LKFNSSLKGVACSFIKNSAIMITALVFQAAVFLATPADAASLGAIGSVSDVQLVAYGTPEKGLRAPKFLRDGVSLYETLETADNGALKIDFVDDTVLHLGGSAKVTVDEMIFDPDSKQGSAVVKLATGTFFWVSGHMANKQGVQIETPVATIGIRGTEFSVNVDGSGKTSVSVISGEVKITSKLTGRSQIIPQGKNASILKTGSVSPVRVGIVKTGDMFIDKVVTNAATGLIRRAAVKMNGGAKTENKEAKAEAKEAKAEAKVANDNSQKGAKAANGRGPAGKAIVKNFRSKLKLLPVRLQIIKSKIGLYAEHKPARRYILDRSRKVIFAGFGAPQDFFTPSPKFDDPGYGANNKSEASNGSKAGSGLKFQNGISKIDAAPQVKSVNAPMNPEPGGPAAGPASPPDGNSMKAMVAPAPASATKPVAVVAALPKPAPAPASAPKPVAVIAALPKPAPAPASTPKPVLTTAKAQTPKPVTKVNNGGKKK